MIALAGATSVIVRVDLSNELLFNFVYSTSETTKERVTSKVSDVGVFVGNSSLSLNRIFGKLENDKYANYLYVNSPEIELVQDQPYLDYLYPNNDIGIIGKYLFVTIRGVDPNTEYNAGIYYINQQGQRLILSSELVTTYKAGNVTIVSESVEEGFDQTNLECARNALNTAILIWKAFVSQNMKLTTKYKKGSSALAGFAGDWKEGAFEAYDLKTWTNIRFGEFAATHELAHSVFGSRRILDKYCQFPKSTGALNIDSIDTITEFITGIKGAKTYMSCNHAYPLVNNNFLGLNVYNCIVLASVNAAINAIDSK